MTLDDAAECIWRAGLDGVAPQRLIDNGVAIQGDTLEISGLGLAGPGGAPKKFDLSAQECIYLIAFGKAAPGMAAAMVDVLGRRLLAGVIVARPGEGGAIVRASGVRVIEAPHPLPNPMLSPLKKRPLYAASDRDLLIVLLSGGGSAQVALPLPGITLEDKLRISRDLMLRGAGITELNIVRKHLSAVKGGRLAEAAYPAGVLNIAISDVIGESSRSSSSGKMLPPRFERSSKTGRRASFRKHPRKDIRHSNASRLSSSATMPWPSRRRAAKPRSSDSKRGSPPRPTRARRASRRKRLPTGCSISPRREKGVTGIAAARSAS